MGRVQSKVILVTGGVGDIGESICTTLAEEGAKVAIADIADGKSLEEELLARGFDVKFWPLDVSDENQIANVVEEVHAKWGTLNGLVNNAAIPGESNPTEFTNTDNWDEVMRINVRGTALCVKHVVPYMRKSGGGSIVNIASVYGLVGSPRRPAYHASKGAIRVLTKTDALSYYRDKIRVNAVSPGLIETVMLKEKFDVWDDRLFDLEGLQPLGLGKPKDIAYAVLYLSSDESVFMTGSEILIDGGYSIW